MHIHRICAACVPSPLWNATSPADHNRTSNRSSFQPHACNPPRNLDLRPLLVRRRPGDDLDSLGRDAFSDRQCDVRFPQLAGMCGDEAALHTIH